jgi:hypothetical protein
MTHEEPAKRRVSEIQLGDALGDDAKLAKELENIAKYTNADSPGISGWKAVVFLRQAWELTAPAAMKMATIVKRGVGIFTDYEIRRLAETHKGKKEEILASAEAEFIRSNAGINDAKAERERARAEEERAATRRRDLLLQKLLKGRIDFSAEERDGILRIAFVKGEDGDAKSG